MLVGLSYLLLFPALLPLLFSAHSFPLLLQAGIPSLFITSGLLTSGILGFITSVPCSQNHLLQLCWWHKQTCSLQPWTSGYTSAPTFSMCIIPNFNNLTSLIVSYEWTVLYTNIKLHLSKSPVMYVVVPAKVIECDVNNNNLPDN